MIIRRSRSGGVLPVPRGRAGGSAVATAAAAGTAASSGSGAATTSGSATGAVGSATGAAMSSATYDTVGCDGGARGGGGTLAPLGGGLGGT